MKNRFPRVALTTVAILTAYWLGTVNSAPHVHADATPPSPFGQLTTFARVLSHIDRSYVDPIDEEDLLYTAIKAMVRSLDPHSNFMTPDEFSAMREDTRGEYVGVGMEVGLRDGNVTVISPFEGGPAFEAGIEAGDVIVQIDGVGFEDSSVDAVVQVLRGDQGTPVDLVIRRAPDDGEEGDTETHTFTVVRDVIHVNAVESRLLSPGLGLISVRQFQAGVTTDVVTALDTLQVENEGELTGLVLDMRNNPGGLLSEAISMSDLFISEGVVVTTEGRNVDENDIYEATEGATRFTGDLVALVNGGTASASEIVAGALQDHGRAAVIGTTTFGKGTVQSIIDFADGSGLKLTTARYFTPEHLSIHGQGSEPDFAGRPGDGTDPDVDANDIQIVSAVDHLRGRTPRGFHPTTDEE